MNPSKDHAFPSDHVVDRHCTDSAPDQSAGLTKDFGKGFTTHWSAGRGSSADYVDHFAFEPGGHEREGGYDYEDALDPSLREPGGLPRSPPTLAGRSRSCPVD